MARLDWLAVTTWITAEALAHPRTLRQRVAERCGVGSAAAGRVLQRLVDTQWLVREGTARQPQWRPGRLRQVVRRYPIAGLQEDTPWVRDFAPCFSAPAPALRIVQHLFTELVNNAVDHSEGQWVTVSMRQTAAHLQLLVSDDGRGLFDKVGEAFGLDDPAHAMLELSKGRLTTLPERHTGRGLFFAPLLADVFDLHANAVGYQYRPWADGWQDKRPLGRRGTSAYAAVALETTRSIEAVMAEHSVQAGSLVFDRTVVPLRLLCSAASSLESRAQARRVAARLASFRRAEVDFSGVPHVGHAFADELFRVEAGRLPNLDLVPTHMRPEVAAVVASVEGMARAA